MSTLSIIDARKYSKDVLIAHSASPPRTPSSAVLSVAGHSRRHMQYNGAQERHPSLLPRSSNICGGNAQLSQCGSTFPSTFCCSHTSICIALNTNNSTLPSSSKSVICCPSGASCQQIRPITCDISLQNATAAPGNAVHTTNLTATLESCGNLCCPLGYTCEGGACNMIAGAIIPSPSPSASSSSTAAPTSTSSSSSSSSTSAAGVDRKSHGIGPGVIVGVVVACVAFGAFLAVGCVYYFRRRAATKRTHARQRSREVSEPLHMEGFGTRTDFLRRGGAAAGRTSDDTELLPSSPNMRDNAVGESSKGRAESEGTMPRTASSETIEVAMPPPVPSFMLGRYLENASTAGGESVVGNRNRGLESRRVSQGTIGTTFSQLLESAGFGRESRANFRGWPGRR